MLTSYLLSYYKKTKLWKGDMNSMFCESSPLFKVKMIILLTEGVFINIWLKVALMEMNLRVLHTFGKSFACNPIIFYILRYMVRILTFAWLENDRKKFNVWEKNQFFKIYKYSQKHKYLLDLNLIGTCDLVYRCYTHCAT